MSTGVGCHCLLRQGLHHLVIFLKHLKDFSGGASGKEPASQCRRHKRCGFDSWVRKIPWMRVWQSSPIFLPGESYGQRSLVDCSPWGHSQTGLKQLSRHSQSTLSRHYVLYHDKLSHKRRWRFDFTLYTWILWVNLTKNIDSNDTM